MIKKLLFLTTLFCCLLFSKEIKAQTLTAGDIAFLGMNASPSNTFTFITLKDIPANEILYFTDQGWNVNQWQALSPEGHISWVIPSGGLSCGTIVSIAYNGTAFTVTGATGTTPTLAVVGNGFNLSFAGDQVIAYQSTTGVKPISPTFIAAIHMNYDAGIIDTNTMWATSASTGNSSDSTIPTGLINGQTCVALYNSAVEPDSAKYTNTTNSLTGTSAQIRTLANDRTKWTLSTTVLNLNPNQYDTPNVTCTASTAPVVTTNTPVTNFGAVKAVLGGSATDGGAAISERGIVWALATNPAIGAGGVTKVTNGTGTGSFSATINSLPPATTIYYRAYAINSVGTSYGASVSFTTNAALTATQSQTDPTCNNGTNGTATVTPSGGKTPYTYSWSPSGDATATASGLGSGNYQVLVTDNEGTSLTKNYTLNNPVATPVTITTQPASISVCPVSNITLSSVASNATSYQWYVSTGTGNPFTLITNVGSYSNATTASLSIGNITTGMDGYRYHVIASNTCASATSSDATLTVNSLTTVQSNVSNPTICTGATTSISATNNNATSIKWQYDSGTGTFADVPNAAPYSGVATSTLSITNATAAMSGYKFRLSASGLCNTNVLSNEVTLTVDAGSAPVISVQPVNKIVCAPSGSTIFSVTASGVATYKWQVNTSGTWNDVNIGAPYSGATTNNLTVAATTVMNNYQYRVVLTGSCNSSTTSDAATLNITTITAASTSTPVSCFGGSNGTATVTPSGGTGSYTYQWSANAGNANTQTASGLTAGTYQVTIKDSNLCTATTTAISVGGPAAPLNGSISITDVSCFGESSGTATVVASGGSPSYTYEWSANAGNATTQTVTGLSSGTYQVKITDANSCSITINNIQVMQPAAILQASTATTAVSCFGGSNGSASVTATGGTAGYTYAWSPLGGAGSSISGRPAGNYQCTITDSKGCTITKNVTIATPSVLSLTMSKTDVSCNNGLNGKATVTVTGGTGAYTYVWAPVGGTAATTSGLAAGTYTVTVTDANNCQLSQSIIVDQPALLTATSSKTDVLCNGGSTGTATATPSGGNGGYTYVWRNISYTVVSTAATATGLPAGNYSCMITDSKECYTTLQNITINQPALLMATTSQINATCTLGGQAGVTASGGTGAYTYLWTPSGQTTASITGLAAGNYSCLITDANGCFITKNFTINTTNTLTATTAQTAVLCNGGNTGSASVIPAGAPGPFTYAWLPTGGNASTAANLTAGNYSVTITASNGCSITKTIIVSQPAGLVATQGPKTNLICNGGTNGSAQVNVTGGTGAYTYLWAPSGGTAATATGLSAGTYTVTVKDANLCETTQSFIITQPEALVITPTHTNVNCNGGATGSATANVTGGTGAYTYVWAPTGGTAATASGLTAGTYTVTVKDANLCQTTQSFIITQPTTLVATAGITTNVLCHGAANGTATVNVTGGTGTYTYSWNTVPVQTTATATGLAPGNYTVTVKDANLCQTTQLFTIIEPVNIITATAGPQNNILCNGGTNGSATVNVTGGTGVYTYVWAPSGGTAATASGLSAGTYTVTVKDANLCQTTQSFTITEPTALIATTGLQNNILCNGGTNGSATVNVTGGTGAYTYVWAPSGGTAATASGLTAGTYTVTVKDANLCQTTQSFTITEPTALVATAGLQNNILCNGGTNGSATVNVTGGTGVYTYVWAPSGGTAATATGLSTGTYTVTVKDANLCQTTQSFTITQPTVLAVTEGVKTNVLCHGAATGTATVNVTGGTGVYTYTWSPSGGTAATATGLSAGMYTVTVKDANLCEATQSFTITEPSTSLTAAAGPQTNIQCNNGANGSATVNVAGGTAPYTYSWNTVPVQTTATATALTGGTYIVTVTDANGCTATQSFTIIQSPALVLSGTSTNISCHGAANGTANVTVTGGTAPYTYLWSTGAATSALTGLAAGTYTCNVADANGCTATSSFTIYEQSQITATSVKTDVSCHGGTNGSATITAAGGVPGYSYAWSNGAGGPTVTGLAAGIYTINITDTNACSITHTVTIAEPALLDLDAAISNISCSENTDGAIDVTVSGGTAPYTYAWLPNLGTTSSISGLGVGIYSLTVTDSKGCTVTESFTIAQPTPLSVTISQTDVSCFEANDGTLGVAVTGGSGPYSYTWTPNVSTEATATGLSAGNYSVTITDTNGCSTLRNFSLSQPAALNITATSTPPLCNSENNGTATVTVTGGTAPYTYLWSNGSTTAAATGLIAGTYTVDVTDAHGCIKTATVTIIAPLAVVITTQPQDVTILQGTNASYTVIATNAVAYQWQVSTDGDNWTNIINGGANPTYSGALSTTLVVTNVPESYNGYTYRVLITNSSGCVSISDAALLEISDITGTDTFEDLRLTIYPNPASTEVFIKLTDFSSHNNIKAELYDLNGRLVRQDRITSETYSMNVTGLESAVYILNITSDTGKTTKRIVVDKKFQ